ncbi:hypothetical protein CMI37_20335 [Candidatus Pacearchaeota archaeon]|nr:hypothetical protein [Candidatus Pacearchaeota archaeon]|tara:strand:+ start:5829 stop:6038 length:210 start_codon:yes stop_codon:yes gene_type:complete
MVTFDYKDWDDLNDLLLERPGSTIGYGAIKRNLALPSQVAQKNALRATYEIPSIRREPGTREPNKLINL